MEYDSQICKAVQVQNTVLSQSNKYKAYSLKNDK